MTVRTEADLLRSLGGRFTLEELYAAVEAADLTQRDDGETVIHGRSDTRWKRRVRGALVTMGRQGRARHAGDRTWILDGTPEAPRRAVLVSLSGGGDIDLRLRSAAQLLRELDEPADLIVADPPWGLGVGRGVRQDTGHRTYARNHGRVVAGYQDVDPHEYRDFTGRWIEAAASALRPGGHLAVITGPQQSAWVQTAAEDAGLSYVNSIAVGKYFPLRTTRRFAHAHWRVTVMCQGPLSSKLRVFIPPPDLPLATTGATYPQDLWLASSVGRADARPGQLRYSNSLPVRLVNRVVGAFTQAGDLLVDPFLGGGTSALVALLRGLRFVGGDTNEYSLAFSAHRISRELIAA
jgi:DNA modification methylase